MQLITFFQYIILFNSAYPTQEPKLNINSLNILL